MAKEGEYCSNDEVQEPAVREEEHYYSQRAALMSAGFTLERIRKTNTANHP